MTEPAQQQPTMGELSTDTLWCSAQPSQYYTFFGAQTFGSDILGEIDLITCVWTSQSGLFCECTGRQHIACSEVHSSELGPDSSKTDIC